jgi:hypothetical protein
VHQLIFLVSFFQIYFATFHFFTANVSGGLPAGRGPVASLGGAPTIKGEDDELKELVKTK